MKIMFVCHGNICRSPMAEFIMRSLLSKSGKQHDVFSAAATDEEIGNPIYPPAKRVLTSHGIDFSEHFASNLKREDYGKYDLFIGMDGSNIRRMLDIFGGDPDGKVKKLTDYTCPGTNVSDPWYTGDFETAFRDIYNGCEALLKTLE